jgi:menaquinone-dependent protoporphyrinogen oxidase
MAVRHICGIVRDMKVLVTAASKHGATHEIAAAIGRGLRERGLIVDVNDIADVPELGDIDACVLGSAVYVGQWLAPARQFVEANAEAFSAIPTWLFSSGPLGDPLKPDEEHAVNVAEIVAATNAREHRLFAGALDKGKLGFGERAVVMAVRAADGDYRNWDEIAAWTGEIAAALSDPTGSDDQ